MKKRPQQQQSIQAITLQNIQGQQQQQQTSKKAEGNLHNGAKSNPVKDSCVTCKVTAVTINVFFDGTKNNLYNTDANHQTGVNPKQVSYSNEYTNVAWLYSSRPRNSSDVWVYVEGMGTKAGEEDDKRGYGFGTGPTGITSRVAEAFTQVVTEYNKKNSGTPQRLLFNVFGFSRGAASARHFIDELHKNPNRFPSWSLNKSQVQVNFVGLFDTVSSYAPGASIDFENDVGELGLDFKAGYAKKVFHLAALDEYRENFSLTDIRSARGLGFGYEVLIHGAHSDIGASYNAVEEEVHLVNAGGTKMYDWMINEGWYKKEQVMTGSRHWIGQRKVWNNYFKVPLKIMKTMASKHAGLSFSFPNVLNTDANRNISIYLNSFVKDVLAKEAWPGLYAMQWSVDDEYRYLHNTFLHFSAQYTLGLGIRLVNGLPKRKVIPG